jgi:Ser/Thr protein kinase RdoA (MazF antagonist)
MKSAMRAAENFAPAGTAVAGVAKHGRGIVHETFLVTLDGGNGRFILQRLNSRVFPDPAALMKNMEHVCRHLRERLGAASGEIAREWRVVRLLPARDNTLFFRDRQGAFWRALSFIDGAVPLEQVKNSADAREAGRALGIFHWLVSDINPAALRVALPGFHDVAQYLQHYDAVQAMDTGGGGESFCRRFIGARRQWAPVLENGLRAGRLQVRVIHGDAKINNVMVSSETGRAVSMIDLDTVMAGPVHFDIGDCLRSCCNTGSEEEEDPSQVRFDLDRCWAALSGYVEAAHRFLTDADYDFFFAAVRRIPFELGLRFYTDYLEGDVYFKVQHPGQNLARALVQFKLTESIEAQEREIRKLIKECRARYGPGRSR